jgi:hypothetical protein
MTNGIGTRLQHTQHGPGVIVGIKFATYIISFIHAGIKEIDKEDSKLDEFEPENVTELIESQSEVELSLLKILRKWNGVGETVLLGDRWKNGTMLLQPAEKTRSQKKFQLKTFFIKW